jgi:membrane AbrB-like protein
VTLAAQMVTGATTGTYMSIDTLRGIGGAWLPVIGITLATLLLSFGAGVQLARIADVEPATAAFGMIAGGAAGIVTIATDLGADDRMVAVMQYLRVLLILALTPVLAALFFGRATHGHSGAEVVHYVGYPAGILFVVVCGPLGLLIARKLRMPSPNFFGPMTIGAILTLTNVPFAGRAPSLILYVALGIIGVKVGLDFTPASLRRAKNMLPAVIGVILLMLAACAALGLVMAPLAGVSSLDGYLATTPGVLQVVVATAIGMKANTTFIVAAQVLRLLMMLVAAPVVAKRLIPPAVSAGLARTADV